MTSVVPDADQLATVKTDLPTSYRSLNAMLAAPDDQGRIPFDSEHLAVRKYFLDDVNQNMMFFHSLKEKMKRLLEEGYYESDVLDQYSNVFIESLFKQAYAKKFRFRTFKGAMKFYTGYAMRSFDRTRYIERYEDRVCMVALKLAQGREQEARDYVDEMMSQRFQPATPTFSNAGKKSGGDLVSCYLISCADDMENICRAGTSAKQLSKRGGGVAICLTDVRGVGAPIQRIKGVGSGIIPIMKMLENDFSYANQLGSRDGSGAVYISACHPDIMLALDTKRENADDSVRIKSLSLGLMIPDILYKLAIADDDFYTFEPYDVFNVYGIPLSRIGITKHYYQMVDDPRITKKKMNARAFMTEVARVQTESGYPYIINEDVVNEANPIHGYINMSNLCVEIHQVNTPSFYHHDLSYKIIGKDISCNLGSLNAVKCLYGPDFGKTVEVATRGLTSVSLQSTVDSVPSIRYGNDISHAIGLGVMNLHGLFAKEKMFYGSEESLDLTNMFFYALNYYSIMASNKIAIEYGETFYEFEKSTYATGTYFDKYTDQIWIPRTEKVKALLEKVGFHVPTQDEWKGLKLSVQRYGLFNQYRLAVAPTGSISYINDSTASISPVADKIEARKEVSDGLIYYPAPELTNDNQEYFENAYEVGYKRQIDVCAEATPHVDQGISMTLSFGHGTTTRTINNAQIYARTKNIKSIYYTRVRKKPQNKIAVDEVGCVACAV